MPEEPAELALFHPVVRTWFERRFGSATEIQRYAWPHIAAGEHVLVTAPTGSGKTLTAFLWALNQLLTGTWSGDAVRVLYLSPLKALNNDIQRNLFGPLAELDAEFERAGLEPSPVRVGVRSGDTSARDRRRMLRQPPEILITTPESFNILLTSASGKRLFTDLETVILDEIHAVAGSKRGTHLMSAVDRAVELSGEFQRVALSATVRPRREIARFMAGYRLDYTGGEPVFTARRVTCVDSKTRKKYDLKVCRAPGLETPPQAGDEQVPVGPPANLWEALTDAFRERIESNRSTLLFANSRRATEKITRLLNEGSRSGKRPDDGPSDGRGTRRSELAYSHHGSLSRELRAVVEERLKEGRLKAIVATNSLELGIDIGALDEVLLVQTPATIASTVQRVGRAGHGVGETSRARLYPLFGRDILQAAVTARCVLKHDIEETHPIQGALDVLAQIILSMTAGKTRQVDQLFDRIRTSYPYRQLSKKQFDLVIEMLAGRYADSRMRELEPRLLFDRLDGTVRARRGSDRLLYVAGGTIPDRGYFQLRHHESLAKLGELDEEFVWERSLGDTFTLGAQSWRIRKITHSDVLVSPAQKGAAFAPFWRAEERNRSFHLSLRIGEFLENANSYLGTTNGNARLAADLESRFVLDRDSAADLVNFLELQKGATGGLPHRHRVVAEKLAEFDEETGLRTWVIHTGWGGRVNRPLALVLAAAYQNLKGEALEADGNNDSLLVMAPEGFKAGEVLEFLASQPIEMLLKKTLEKTGFFGARFRENAGRALLLPRSSLKRRVPLWLQRERGKKLLGAVSRYGDFPIVLETWRTCLEDMFDLDALKKVLSEIERGEVRVDEVMTSTPSPFSADLMWKRTNRLMYVDDSPDRDRAGALKDSVLRELIFSAELRPRFTDELLEEFERKLQRTHPGYSPRDGLELIEWVKERWLIPEDEWRKLADALERDHAAREDSLEETLESAGPKLVRATWGKVPVVCALERLSQLENAFGKASQEKTLGGGFVKRPEGKAGAPLAVDQILAEWLSFYGPVEEVLVLDLFGLGSKSFQSVAETMVNEGQWVVDRFRRDREDTELCDVENLERLLRIQRARARPRLEARPISELPLFLATRQGLVGRPPEGSAGGSESLDLQQVLGRFLGYPAPAGLWETEILPARLSPYYPSWLDSLFQETDFLWVGCGRERICFGFPEEIGLLTADSSEQETKGGKKSPIPQGRFRLEEFANGLGLTLDNAVRELWSAAWDGRLSNTTFSSVRHGVANRFRFPSGRERTERAASTDGESVLRHRPARRRTAERWRPKAFYPGDWFTVDQPVDVGDALDRAEANKDRVRLLLDRYGVLFRELLDRELPTMRWSKIFRTLRLMELSGEIVSGQFFEDVLGPQFAAHDAIRLLRDGLPADAVFWMCAADPAAPTGLGFEEFKGRVPRRLPSGHLVFHGSRIVVVSERNGSRLEIRASAEDPRLEEYLAFLKNLLTRPVEPLRAVDIAEINGEGAAVSVFAPALRRMFEATREGSLLRLRRRYVPAVSA